LRAQRRGEKLRTLTIVPAPVIATDGVMVRDRATRLDQRIAGRILDRLPLFEQRGRRVHSRLPGNRV
jgi:hypothetical protein